MRLMSESEARFYFPISVLVIRREGIKYLIDDWGFLVDVETFLAEGCRYGWDIGHVAPLNVKGRRSVIGEFFRFKARQLTTASCREEANGETCVGQDDRIEIIY